jgi:hypothetical protein
MILTPKKMKKRRKKSENHPRLESPICIYKKNKIRKSYIYIYMKNKIRKSCIYINKKISDYWVSRWFIVR